MAIRLTSYNIEWFNKLFETDNTLKTDQASTDRFNAIASVLQTLDSDIIGIVEAPNTGGNQSTVTKLQNFANTFNLKTDKALTGFTSKGQQEIAVLFNSTKLKVAHKPGGSGTKNPPFNNEFRVDTDQDKIKEVYSHYRPPLEVEVTLKANNKKFRLIVAHIKSKGIFSNMDRLNWERANKRNRLKIIGEASSVRRRVDEFLDAGHNVIVMGDVNDGPGMDYYEFMFGRSGVEIVMGDIFEPGRILRSVMGRPKFGNFGWEPSSARFKDSFTEDMVNVLIDHILISDGVKTSGQTPHKVWNPFQDNDAKNIKQELLDASDHFPITLDMNP